MLHKVIQAENGGSINHLSVFQLPLLATLSSQSFYQQVSFIKNKTFAKDETF